jgi:hypothetical protein
MTTADRVTVDAELTGSGEDPHFHPRADCRRPTLRTCSIKLRSGQIAADKATEQPTWQTPVAVIDRL